MRRLSGATIHPFEAKAAGELEAAFDGIAKSNSDALLIVPDALLTDLREPIASLALKHRIATLSTIPELTEAGGLIGYGVPRRDLYRRSGHFVKRILDGANPRDMPVEQPTHLQLSVNAKTATVLGISIPGALLGHAVAGQKVLSECCRSDFGDVFVLGDGEHLLFRQAAEPNAVFKRDHVRPGAYYSITSSARAESPGGTISSLKLRSIALAETSTSEDGRVGLPADLAGGPMSELGHSRHFDHEARTSAVMLKSDITVSNLQHNIPHSPA